MSSQGPWSAVTGAMSSWYQGKLFIEHATTIQHDALHLMTGAIAWLVFGTVLRRPLASLRPWLWVLALILWNEAVDLWMERWPDAGMQYGEGAKDILTTMFVPTLFILAMRFAPGLFTAAKRRR